eukprot:XP_027326613.1 protein CutA homolog [Anas platyrhynchos]
MEALSQRCPLPAAQGCPRPGRGTVLLVMTLSLLMYPVLRSLALQMHAAITGSYISGTHSIAFINCLNEQIAKDIARGIMDKRLAAYVNILPKSSALYFWKGELEESTEILLLVKTRTSKIGELSNYVRSLPGCLPAGFLPSPAPSTARAPGSQLLAVVNPKLKAKSSHGKKERSIHPFEIPEVISLPIDQGNPLYLKWIEENVPRD